MVLYPASTASSSNGMNEGNLKAHLVGPCRDLLQRCLPVRGSGRCLQQRRTSNLKKEGSGCDYADVAGVGASSRLSRLAIKLSS